MKIINGNQNCFVCGKEFKWYGLIENGNNQSFKIPFNEVEANICAIGNVNTTADKKNKFEVITKCPHCRNKNKFEGNL